MSVALFVPCYVDQLRPRVGLAALDLLRTVRTDVRVIDAATCCGQPFLTAGEQGHAKALGRRFAAAAQDAEAIVIPSGSCVATLRGHLPRLDADTAACAERVFELSDYLANSAGLPAPRTPFPHRVGLHASCHGLRELRQGNPSETREPTRPDPARALLERVPGLVLTDLARRDECCGFGGVFSVEEEAVSSRMGLDRLEDHRRGHARVLTSTDVSCLLHLEGLARRSGPPLRVLHVAEILAESILGPGWLAQHADAASDRDAEIEAMHGAR